MKLEIPTTKSFEPKYLVVSANVRYWEDSSINGEDDTEDGQKIPLRNGDKWEILVNLETGKVADWPLGTTAHIHYKVCDEGEYWLIDDLRDRVKYKDSYVPSFLGVSGESYGDYIAMNINEEGFIEDWEFPKLNPEDWKFTENKI